MSELIYGRRAVLESLRARRRQMFRLWLEDSAPKTRQSESFEEILGLSASTKVPTRTVRGGIFDKLAAQSANAQGVALEVAPYPYVEFADVLDQPLAVSAGEQTLPPLILILDHVQDPQNLGSLFRTAEAMAVDGVILPDRRAAGITPAVVNASAGAVEHLRVAQVSNVNRVIDQLKDNDFWVAGLEDVSEASPWDEDLLHGKLAVVVGSEGTGIRRLTREKCDFVFRLPMFGRIESYNAAVAGSIMLFEIRRIQSRRP